jgi:hypothetical protein
MAYESDMCEIFASTVYLNPLNTCRWSRAQPSFALKRMSICLEFELNVELFDSLRSYPLRVENFPT